MWHGGGAVGHRVDGHDVEQRIGCQHDKGTEYRHAHVFAEQRAHRHFDLFLRGGHFGEYRRFMQRHANVQANDHQHCREDKRHAPAPGHELLVGQQPGEQQESAVRKEEANRRAQLRERAVQRTLTRRGVLGRQQRRAAPFAAKPQTLAKARQRQQHRRQNANGFVTRQQADHHGGDPHGKQWSNQRHLTANAVAEVAK